MQYRGGGGAARLRCISARLPHRLEGERRRDEQHLADALRVVVEHDLDEETDERQVGVLEAADTPPQERTRQRTVRAGGDDENPAREAAQRGIRGCAPFLPRLKFRMSKMTMIVSVLYPSAWWVRFRFFRKCGGVPARSICYDAGAATWGVLGPGKAGARPGGKWDENVTSVGRWSRLELSQRVVHQHNAQALRLREVAVVDVVQRHLHADDGAAELGREGRGTMVTTGNRFEIRGASTGGEARGSAASGAKMRARIRGARCGVDAAAGGAHNVADREERGLPRRRLGLHVLVGKLVVALGPPGEVRLDLRRRVEAGDETAAERAGLVLVVCLLRHQGGIGTFFPALS